MTKTRTTGTSHIHTVRTRDGKTKTLRLTRHQAINAYCTECLGWEVHPFECTDKLCPLYPFRNQTTATQKGKMESKQDKLPF